MGRSGGFLSVGVLDSAALDMLRGRAGAWERAFWKHGLLDTELPDGRVCSRLDFWMHLAQFTSPGCYPGWLMEPSRACGIGTSVFLSICRWGSQGSER